MQRHQIKRKRVTLEDAILNTQVECIQMGYLFHTVVNHGVTFCELFSVGRTIKRLAMIESLSVTHGVGNLDLTVAMKL